MIRKLLQSNFFLDVTAFSPILLEGLRILSMFYQECIASVIGVRNKVFFKREGVFLNVSLSKGGNPRRFKYSTAMYLRG